MNDLWKRGIGLVWLVICLALAGCNSTWKTEYPYVGPLVITTNGVPPPQPSYQEAPR